MEIKDRYDFWKFSYRLLWQNMLMYVMHKIVCKATKAVSTHRLLRCDKLESLTLRSLDTASERNGGGRSNAL